MRCLLLSPRTACPSLIHITRRPCDTSSGIWWTITHPLSAGALSTTAPRWAPEERSRWCPPPIHLFHPQGPTPPRSRSALGSIPGTATSSRGWPSSATRQTVRDAPTERSISMAGRLSFGLPIRTKPGQRPRRRHQCRRCIHTAKRERFIFQLQSSHHGRGCVLICRRPPRVQFLVVLCDRGRHAALFRGA